MNKEILKIKEKSNVTFGCRFSGKKKNFISQLPCDFVKKIYYASHGCEMKRNHMLKQLYRKITMKPTLITGRQAV